MVAFAWNTHATQIWGKIQEKNQEKIPALSVAKKGREVTLTFDDKLVGHFVLWVPGQVKSTIEFSPKQQGQFGSDIWERLMFWWRCANRETGTISSRYIYW